LPDLGESQQVKSLGAISSSEAINDRNRNHEVKVIHKDEYLETKRMRREKLTCCKCLIAKNEEKFSSKQWGMGLQRKQRKVYCRRCEEKRLIRQRVGPAKEKLCIRIHTKTRPDAKKAKYISTMIPVNTKTNFLPSDLAFDGYTRESWSLEGNEFEGAWRTTILRCVVGSEKVAEFVNFLGHHKKSAYGTFLLRDGTDGFFFVPHYQQPNCARDKPTNKETKPRTALVCKYVLGLNLTERDGQEKCSARQKEDPEDYISPSVLGSLLLAKIKTDYSLTAVPKGSVRAALKPKSNLCRSKRSNVSEDWFGPKLIIQEGGE